MSPFHLRGAPVSIIRLTSESVTVLTQVNLPEARVTEMSDADLEAYDRLLTELRELLPKDEPKRIGGVSR